MNSTLLAVALIQASPMENVTLTIDGVSRQFYAYIPKTKDATPRPVVFAFHGHGGMSSFAVRKFHVDQLWPEAVSIYPQGLPTKVATDREGKQSGWQLDVGTEGDRDLKFFDAMLKWVHEKAIVNDKAVFSIGHSNGAIFSYLLWKARPKVIAGIAPVAAIGVATRGTTPIPVFHTSGKKDPILPFRAQERVVNHMREVNQCDANGKAVGSHMTRWDSKVGAPVVWYVHDGGHEMPEDALNESIKFLKGLVKS